MRVRNPVSEPPDSRTRFQTSGSSSGSFPARDRLPPAGYSIAGAAHLPHDALAKRATGSGGGSANRTDARISPGAATAAPLRRSELHGGAWSENKNKPAERTDRGAPL
ncbi:hypothetical protein AGIG_G23380 [Arapaima gigas]